VRHYLTRYQGYHENPGLGVLFWLAFCSATVAYVLPVYTDIGAAGIYWLAGLSSLLIAFYVYAYVSRHGWLPYESTPVDVLVTLYVAWAVVGFFTNSIVNVLAGNVDQLIVQVQSLVTFILILLHYVWGRFSDRFNFPFTRFTSYTFGLFVLACISVFLYVLLTGDLYLARGELGQRFPLLVVFWAWLFGGLWLVTGNKRYLAAFLIGSMVCLISLTRAAYLQWAACAIAMLLAVGSKRVFKGVLGVAIVFGIAGAALAHFDDSVTAIVVDRFSDFMFSIDLADSDSSTSFRVGVWQGIFKLLLENPLALVFGYGQMGPSYLPIDFISDAGDIGRGTSAHSQYLDTLVRMGMPGLILEVSITVFVSSVLFVRSQPPYIKIVSACLLGHLIFGIFHETLRWPVFGVLFWFFVGITSQSLERRARVQVEFVNVTHPEDR
jgi:O-antigen ligase/polysaccharide polymerase Wzy-like membrane protein